MNPLEVNISSLKIRNPTMLAAGVLGISASLLRNAYKSGAGIVVTKSISKNPRFGNRNPVVYELKYGLLNSIGLSNPGCEEFLKEVNELRKDNIPFILSVYGESVDEFKYLIKFFNDYVNAFELNLSCPNVKTGLEFIKDVELVFDIVREVKSITKKPIFVKISATVNDVVDVGKACEEAGADAIVAINSIKAMKIDIRLKKPVLSSIFGGLSGEAIKPIALRCVYELKKELSIPIIGCGGISCGEDAVEFLLAGASAIQIGTAVYKKGLRIFRDICMFIKNYLNENGYSKLDEIIGLAHKA